MWCTEYTVYHKERSSSRSLVLYTTFSRRCHVECKILSSVQVHSTVIIMSLYTLSCIASLTYLPRRVLWVTCEFRFPLPQIMSHKHVFTTPWFHHILLLFDLNFTKSDIPIGNIPTIPPTSRPNYIMWLGDCASTQTVKSISRSSSSGRRLRLASLSLLTGWTAGSRSLGMFVPTLVFCFWDWAWLIPCLSSASASVAPSRKRRDDNSLRLETSHFTPHTSTPHTHQHQLTVQPSLENNLT